MAQKPSPGIRDYALLVGLAAIFGTSFMFTNIAVQTIPPLTVATGRITLAALAIYAFLLIRGESLPRGSVWVWIIGAAFFGNALPFSLISWGQTSVDSSLTAILMAMIPITTVLIAHVATVDEKLDRWMLIGVFCGFLGVIVLMGFDNLTQLGEQSLPQLAILLATVSYAVNAIIQKKLTHLSKWPMSAALLLAAAALTFPMAMIAETPWTASISSSSIYAVMALAIGPTAIATWLILLIIGRQGASFLVQINFMVPLFGVFFGAVFLKETLPVNAWVALAIILSGVALARRGGRRRET